MKKIICILLLAALLIPAALAYSYDDPALESYAVKLPRGTKALFMYAKASSSGNPVSNYKDGVILKMINYDANKNYCYVIGPDGKVGYVSKKMVEKYVVYDYNDPAYESYRVTVPAIKPILFLYTAPSTSGDPDSNYQNGDILKMLEYEANEKFAFVLGPDGKSGYVSKASISKQKEDGTLGPILEVFSTYATGYCFMYAKPNTGSDNLGQYINGEQIEVIDWSVDERFAFVHGVKDDHYGYIEKDNLHAPGVSPVKGYMMVSALQGYTYAYLYLKASDGSPNLGSYDNGTKIGILDWTASEKYALVYTPDEKIGYMKKDWMVSLFS